MATPPAAVARLSVVMVAGLMAPALGMRSKGAAQADFTPHGVVSFSTGAGGGGRLANFQHQQPPLALPSGAAPGETGRRLGLAPLGLLSFGPSSIRSGDFEDDDDDPFLKTVELLSDDKVKLPRDWTNQFEFRSVFLASAPLEHEVYAALLKGGVGERVLVALTSWPSQDPCMQRMMFAVNRLRSFQRLGQPLSGHVLTFFDTQVIGTRSWFMMEHAERSLDSVLGLDEAQASMKTAPRSAIENQYWLRALPLEEALQLTIDVLRGLVDLEKVGLIHGGLMPHNIQIERGRALVTGFRSMGAPNDGGDKKVACCQMKDGEGSGKVTSPFYEPPEVIDGSPLGPSSHAFAAGMLFAVMSLGYNPAQDFALGISPYDVQHDWAEESRANLRIMLRDGFAIDEDPNFEKLDFFSQDLLMGMLEPNEQKRWSSSEALANFEAVMEKLRLPVLPPRGVPQLPDAVLGSTAQQAANQAATKGGAYEVPPVSIGFPENFIGSAWQ